MVRDRDELLEHVECLLNEGEPERAWMLCKRGLRRFPKDPELWFCLGDSLLESGRFGSSDKAFRRACELRTNWAFPMAKRAEALLMQGRVRKAADLAELAHEADRDLPHSSYVKALIHDVEGDEGAAYFFYRRAQKLSPDEYFAPARVSYERFMKEFDAALKHLNSACCMTEQIEGTRWLVLERVDHSIPELKKLQPMALCHLETKPAPENTEDGPSELPLIETGFIFRRNIERICRTADDICTQIYFSILDELEALAEEAEEDEEKD